MIFDNIQTRWYILGNHAIDTAGKEILDYSFSHCHSLGLHFTPRKRNPIAPKLRETGHLNTHITNQGQLENPPREY